MVQSLIPAIYPILKKSFHLDFSQIGMITLTYQITASLLQPLIGHFNDRHPRPYSLATGMGFTLVGLGDALARIHLSNAFVGRGAGRHRLGGVSPGVLPGGSYGFGGQHGFAQAFFQVGGNAGSSLGPLLAAFIVLPNGQRSLAWFSVFALLGIVVLARVGSWSKKHGRLSRNPRSAKTEYHPLLSPRKVYLSLAVLIALMFSKFFYLSSLTSYYTFFLISKFHFGADAQIHLFMFAGAIAAGTIIGGPIGDRIGVSMSSGAPSSACCRSPWCCPYANLFWTGVLSVIIGVILASAFSAILVYAQEFDARQDRNDLRPVFRISFRHGWRGRCFAGQFGGPHQHRLRL